MQCPLCDSWLQGTYCHNCECDMDLTQLETWDNLDDYDTFDDVDVY